MWCGALSTESLSLCTNTHLYMYIHVYRAGVFEHRPVEVDEDAEMDDDPVLDTGKGNISCIHMNQ